MGYYFNQAVDVVDRPILVTGDGKSDFWRKDDPVFGPDGQVVVGGMFAHQRAWWELPNYFKVLVGGFGAGKTAIGCKRLISLALQNAPVMVASVSPTFAIARRTVVETLLTYLAGRKRNLGREFYYRYNRSSHEFTIRYRGRTGTILILSGDDPTSLRGPNLGAALIDEPFIQDIEVFEQITARVRHPEARHKEICLTGCVTRGTLVLPASGMTAIGNLDPGTQPKQYLPIDQSLYGSHRQFHNATQFFNNGSAETRKIKVTGNYKIEATPDHPLLTMGADGKPEWRQCGRLLLGDKLAIGRGMEVWPGVDPLVGLDEEINSIRTSVKNWRRSRNRITHKLEMTEDLAYFLGLWLAEGYRDISDTRKGGRIGIVCTGHVDWLVKDGVMGLKFKKRKDIYAQIESIELVTLMRFIGMPLVTAPNKFIPDWVFKGKREWALAFIAGMWDGDGTVNKDGRSLVYYTSSQRMARQLQCLLLNLGIMSGRSVGLSEPSVKVKVVSVKNTITVTNANATKLASVLPLRLERKRQLLNNFVKPQRDSDTIPFQAELVKRAWKQRKHLHWRRGDTSFEANILLYTCKTSTDLSYTSLQRFVTKWRANEDFVPQEILDIETNLRDGYYWAAVKEVRKSKAETVDFVVPDTHSFWSNGFISHNTPEQLNWGFDLCMGELKAKNDVGVIQASTRDNKALGTDYVTRLEGVLSERAAKAYIDGALINLSEGLVYYGFDGLSKHNVKDLGTPDNAEIGAGMDFNVNPMSAAVFWKLGQHMHFFAEYELPNADTEFMCDKLREKHGDRLRTVYPDATGNNRHSSSPAGKTDFWYIRQAGYMIDAPPQNGSVKDRYNAVNGKFSPKVGLPTLTISPNCKKLIKYLSTYSHERMNKDDHKAMSHLLDAFSYPVVRLFPVSKETLGVHKLTGH